MKLVREHINEKFSEESDPIRDLGIGGIDINKEWQHILDEFDKGYRVDDIYVAWKQRLYVAWKRRLEQLFLGKIVTGNFCEGNTSSYGGVQRLTTKKPVERIELEGCEDFSLVIKEKDSWRNSPKTENWVNPDEIWYVVELKKNPGRKIFLS